MSNILYSHITLLAPEKKGMITVTSCRSSACINRVYPGRIKSAYIPMITERSRKTMC